MLLDARCAKPLPAMGFVHQSALAGLEASPVALIQAPAGFLLAESLVEILHSWERPIAWFRFGPGSADPGYCLGALVCACQSIDSQLGTATLAEMRSSPGPVFGWPRLFQLLSREIKVSEHKPIVVLAGVENLCPKHQTLDLLISHFVNKLEGSATVLLLTGSPASFLPAVERMIRLDSRHLAITSPQAKQVVDRTPFQFSDSDFDRLLTFAGGRAGFFTSLASLTECMGVEYLCALLQASRNLGDFFARLVRELFISLDTDERSGLWILLATGCFQSKYFQPILEDRSVVKFPWSMPLERGWICMQPLWKGVVRQICSTQLDQNYADKLSLATHLCDRGALHEGIPLHLELGQSGLAGEYIRKNLDTMLESGHWQTVRDWIEKLSAPVQHAEPWLEYVLGEITLANGELERARKSFVFATRDFINQTDLQGACQSLASQATLDFIQGNIKSAEATAFKAKELAETGGVDHQLGWLEFQLGNLSVLSGDLSLATAHYQRAADLAERLSDDQMVSCVRQVQALCSLWQQAAHKVVDFENLLQQAKEVEINSAMKLRKAIDSQSLSAPSAPGKTWLSTPLALRFPPSSIKPVDEQASWFQRAISGLNRFLRGGESEVSKPLVEHRGLVSGLSDFIHLPQAALSEESAVVTNVEPIPIDDNGRAEGQDHPELEIPALEDRRAAATVSVTLTQPMTLSAHMLGRFRLQINDQRVEGLSSGRGVMILKYLIYHHDQRIPREVLMEQFYPDVDPDLARNRLNVALYQVRQELRKSTRDDVIQYIENCYRLNRKLQVWVDAHEFERCFNEACRLEMDERAEDAVRKFEAAATLYQGDFLTSDLYEEWTILIRERLRLANLDVLERLSRHYYQQGQYTMSATLCQKILERDNCREDAHCRLMRCYAQQNQYHLALHQYQICVETLEMELGVAPAPAIVALHDSLLQRVIS